MKSDFKTILHKWPPCWDDVSRATFWSLPWRSRSQRDLAARSQRDLAAKSCPAHNFVFWSRILKIFHRNDHHIETTCRAQHLGRNLECQGHSMTLQQNRVRPIALLFEVWFRNIFHRNDHHIEKTCHAQHLRRYLEGQGHSILAAKSCRAINFVIWDRISKIFHRNDHHIKKRWRAQHLVAILKVKVTVWPCSKIVSGP